MIPLLAAGVINGIGHYWGYRNFENEDASTNVFPIGILIGGEELHTITTPSVPAKLSYQWWEFDIGFRMYIRILKSVVWLQALRGADGEGGRGQADGRFRHPCRR